MSTSGQLARPPQVSIVVPTCADPERVLRCIDGILSCEYPQIEIVVVENRPTGSGTRDRVAAEHGEDRRIRVIDALEPGLSRARNAGLAEASGELVAFVDDDVVVDRDWLRATVQAFERTGADCVTGRIVAQSLESEGARLFDQLASFEKNDGPRLFHRSTGAELGPLFPYAAGMFGSGGNTALRTSIARALGGFDTVLGAGTPALGGEDLDLFVRLLLRGHSIYHEPASIVFHEHPSALEDVRARAFSYGAGLTAMLSAQLAAGPRMPLLRAIPLGIAYAIDPRSRKNAGRSHSYPPQLRRLEWLGMLAGPGLWIKSRWRSRRRARGPGRPR
jgi:GT2 family glycosyltransferase